MKRFSISVALLAIAILGATVLAGMKPKIVLIDVAALSVLTFLVYWWDKSAAQKGSWRTPETTLHILSLCGGWPGALIAQQVLRHKTQKQPFRLILWITVLVNTGVLVCFTLWFNGKL
jgi:uncharacterized membrane protein YsdA (DUF1294 family)